MTKIVVKNKKRNKGNIKVVTKYASYFMRYTSYKIRLQPFRQRFQSVIFRIVVTNSRNRVVDCLGYYNPHQVPFRQTYTSLVFGSLQGKILAIDSVAVVNWFLRGAVPEGCLFVWFEYLGLLKLDTLDQLSDNSKLFLKFAASLYSKDMVQKLKYVDVFPVDFFSQHLVNQLRKFKKERFKYFKNQN